MAGSSKQLEEIKQRIKDTNPGPWRRGIGNEYRNIYSPTDLLLAKTENGFDGMFIAHARDDMPYLLSLLEEAEAQNQRLKNALQEIAGGLEHLDTPHWANQIARKALDECS